MKINLVFNSFPKPSETFLLNLAIELSRIGYNVTLVLLSNVEREANQKHHKFGAVFNNITIVESPLNNHISTFIFLLKRLNGFYRYYTKNKCFSIKKQILNFIQLSLITENKPDVIYFAYSGIAIQFNEILHLIEARVKKFVSCRGSAEIYKPILDINRDKQLSDLWSKVDYVHCVSNDMLERMRRYGLESKKGFVNFPSIDIEKFNFIERNKSHIASLPEKLIIVSTGRLNHQKGYLFALLAIKNLVSKDVVLEYHIFGDGEEYGHLKYFIIDNKLENIVFLHGKVNSNTIKSMLAEAHIFLLSSVYEGISNAVLEAMASGVPVITTDGGGMAEVVTNGVNGIVIPRCDPIAIECAIQEMIIDYSKAIDFASKARKTVEIRFNLENQISRFDQMFKCSVEQL